MSGLSEELMNIGIEKGVKQGIEKGMLQAALKFFKQGKSTLEEIAATLDIPLADVQRYVNQH